MIGNDRRKEKIFKGCWSLCGEEDYKNFKIATFRGHLEKNTAGRGISYMGGDVAAQEDIIDSRKGDSIYKFSLKESQKALT